jgi:hypothetical protein
MILTCNAEFLVAKVVNKPLIGVLKSRLNTVYYELI